MSEAPGEALITIRFLNYWSAGAGASGGGDVDRAVVRARNGLPFLPAKQLKGHLLESATRLRANGEPFWKDWDSSDAILFGVSGAQQAALRFESARLSPPDEAALGVAEGEAKDEAARKARLRAGLFERVASVRIDAETGAARKRAYRRIEAVVPLTLTSVVRRIADAPADWIARLDEACAITLAAGGLKTDGYGRAILSAGPPR